MRRRSERRREAEEEEEDDLRNKRECRKGRRRRSREYIRNDFKDTRQWDVVEETKKKSAISETLRCFVF